MEVIWCAVLQSVVLCHHVTAIAGGFQVMIMVPTPAGKPGKIGEYFPVREKSGNFELIEKVR